MPFHKYDLGCKKITSILNLNLMVACILNNKLVRIGCYFLVHIRRIQNDSEIKLYFHFHYERIMIANFGFPVLFIVGCVLPLASNSLLQPMGEEFAQSLNCCKFVT